MTLLSDYESCDAPMQRAIAAAVSEAAHVCMAVASHDTYGNVGTRAGKPSTRAPGDPSMVGAYRSVLRGFTRIVPAHGGTPRWAARIDAQRDRTDGCGYVRPSGVAGRPSECGVQHIRVAVAMRARGATLEQIACASEVSRSTFYGWLRRGRVAASGLEHELVRALKGGSG